MFDRVNLDLGFLVLQVYWDNLGLRVSQDQRETLVSLEILVHLDGLVLTEL